MRLMKRKAEVSFRRWCERALDTNLPERVKDFWVFGGTRYFVVFAISKRKARS